MAFDGIVTNSLIKELNDKLLDGRISKVYQPENDEVFLHLRSNRENYILLISGGSNNPRFHLTEHTKENPMKPPMFCMILRKYLEGARILNIEQFLMDRIIFIDVSSRDELGIDSEKRLIIEIMGRHSNLILIDKESKEIIDSINRVPEDMSSVRQVLPGLKYELPPLQEKDNPLTTDKPSFLKLMDEEDPATQVFRFFYFNYMGLSPLISREFCYEAEIDRTKKLEELTDKDKTNLYDVFHSYIEDINRGNFSPTLIRGNDGMTMKAFHAFNLDQYGNKISKESFNSISPLLDEYYHKQDHANRINQRAQSLRKSIQVKLDRAINKLSKQRQEFEVSKDREKYKVYADLISANIYHIEKGAEEVTVQNFYDEDLEEITIPLDEKKSAPSNAQRYYKRYSRLKNAHKLLQREIPKTEHEILYLENIIVSIDNTTDINDLDEIRDDLVKEGYIRGKVDRNKRRTKESKPHHYITDDGTSVFVGKNNRQNDNLTFRNSTREDTWMHVQKMPGSHVIIKNNGQPISTETLEDAAMLAAHYSSARNGNNVPIDFTERKHVNKPRGAKAGLVIYDNFETIFITPDLKRINELKKEN